MTLDGWVVVVTGAARGYGRALVDGLLAHGAAVAGIDVSWEPDAYVDGLRARPDALVLEADITIDADVERACESTLQRFGRVDALVNNAALLQRLVFETPSVSVLDSDLATWERMFAVNVLGPVRVTRHFVRPMIEQGRGSIVFVSSGSALRGRPGDQPYGATKAALTNLASSLAAELGPLNIAVNALIPATALTTGYERSPMRVPTPGAPLPAAGNTVVWKTESIVPLVVHLAQQDASTQTGELLKVVEWNAANGLGGDEVWAAV